uniref:HECT-type E3 ubiquitin transferase n=1 Tax=Sphenodon punctatus TaxID=8508 RepID=A0A8D0L6K0_SPHPU
MSTRQSSPSYHTLAYIPTSGQLISFGRGPQRNTENGTSQEDRTQSFDISSLVSANDLSNIQVKMIFAGAYVNFVSILQTQAPKNAKGISSADALPKISRIDRTLIEKWMLATTIWEAQQEAKREIDVIFSSAACLTASFLKPRLVLETNCICVDVQKARDTFDELNKNVWIANTIRFSLSHLIPGLPLRSAHQEAISVFLLLPEWSAMHVMPHLVIQFAKAISDMSERTSDNLEKCWSSLPASFLDNVVQMLKKAVVSHLGYYVLYPYCQNILPLLKALKKLYKVNKVNCILPLSNFYIDEITGTINLLLDLARWHVWQTRENSTHEDDPPVSFCCFPFVLSLVSKMQVFQVESIVVQECTKVEALTLRMQNQMLGNSDLPKLPVLPLRVRRNNLVEDALRKLSLVEDSDLRKELLIEFEGELPGLDAGGVTLNFFLYLFEEMVQPDFGMFMYCEPNSPMWFPTSPQVEKKKYFLFGILCGLSLFNRVIAYIPFPLAVFKKLLDKKPSLEDLKELSPAVGRSLQAVLDYKYDDIEENLQLLHLISWDNQEIDLVPNGSSKAVNNTNKREFVNMYVDYIFNKSVEEVFEEFKRGFYKVIDKKIVQFFQPQELMEVAIGNTNYDWSKFEKNAVYCGGHSSSYPTIKIFWKVFHKLSLEQKKGFLLFLTGTDRITVMGMDALKIKIHLRKDLSVHHLPEAQTCFHILLLPIYHTQKVLKKKLLRAIDNNRGFYKS